MSRLVRLNVCYSTLSSMDRHVVLTIDGDGTCLGQERKENNEGFRERQDYGKVRAAG